MVWVPAVVRDGAEDADAGGQRGVGRQQCVAVAAGELDGAGVAGGGDVARGQRGDHDVQDMPAVAVLEEATANSETPWSLVQVTDSEVVPVLPA